MSENTSKGRRAVMTGVGVLASGIAIAGGTVLLGGPGQAQAVAPAAVAPAAVTSAAPVTATVPVATDARAAKLAAQKAAGITADAASPAPESADDEAVDEFLAKGYTYDDAVSLAKTWGTADPYSAKVKAGQKLEAGQTLPIAAGSTSDAQADPDSAAVDEFFAKGYTYDDAVKLAAMWGEPDAYHAKIKGGQKLEAGQTLPIQP